MEQPESKSCPVKTQRKYTGDIYAEAKDINEARAAKEEEFEDTAGEE